MKTFKEYLVEENLTDKEVRELIKKYRNGELGCSFPNKFPVHSVANGKISCKRDIVITDCMCKDNKLVLPFGIVGRLIFNTTTKTFENFPTIVLGEAKCGFVNKQITSLEGFPFRILGNVILYNLPNLSYANVHKHIEQVTGYIEINAGYVGPMLGFLKIDKLKSISYDHVHSKYQSYFDADANSPCVKAIKIINKHLKLGRDIIACSEELIEAGLKEYAKL